MVDLARGIDALRRDSPSQTFSDLKQPLGGWDRDHRQHLLVGSLAIEVLGGVTVESEVTVFERAQRLLQTLRERSSDRHRLTHALHLCSEHTRRSRELFEGPAGHLRHDVVDRRLEACWSLLRDVIGDLVQRVTDGELGRDLGDRETRRLRGKC